MRWSWWQGLGLVLALLVGVALVWQLARDWGSLAAAIRGGVHIELWPLGLAWLVQSLGWLLMVDTWARIVTRMGGGTAFRHHLAIHTLSGLANSVPGSVWLPASRMVGYRAEGVGSITVGAALVIEWLLLGVAGLLLYGLAAPFAQLPPAVGLLALCVAAGLAGLALHPAVFSRLMGWASARLGQLPPSEQPRPAELVFWCLRCLVVLTLAGVGLYLVMRALGPVAALPDALAVTGLTMALANLLAWLPASALLKDASMAVLLTPMYGSVGMALLLVLVWRLWLVVVQLSWTALALAARRWAAAKEAPWTI